MYLLDAAGAQYFNEPGIANEHDEDIAVSSVSSMAPKYFGQAEQEAESRSVFAFPFYG
jgi:hypothetical protein